MNLTTIEAKEAETGVGDHNGAEAGATSHWPAGSTERVRRLREQLLRTTPSLCAERGLLVTEAYEKYQANPPVLRRAKALAHILANIPFTSGRMRSSSATRPARRVPPRSSLSIW